MYFITAHNCLSNTLRSENPRLAPHYFKRVVGYPSREVIRTCLMLRNRDHDSTRDGRLLAARNENSFLRKCRPSRVPPTSQQRNILSILQFIGFSVAPIRMTSNSLITSWTPIQIQLPTANFQGLRLSNVGDTGEHHFQAVSAMRAREPRAYRDRPAYYDGLKDMQALKLPPMRMDGSHIYCYYLILCVSRETNLRGI